MKRDEKLPEETPDRVLFVNMKDGRVFFDCHPAEARAAIAAVEEMRTSGTFNTKEQREVAADIEKAVSLALPWQIEDWKVYTSANGLNCHIISDMFVAVESKNLRVTHLVMNAYRYADLRKFDRDVMDIETQAWKLRLGWMATIWGAVVIVNTDCPADTVIAVATEKVKPGFATAVKNDPHNLKGFCIRWKFTFATEPIPTPREKIEVLLENIGLRLKRVEEYVGSAKSCPE